LLPVAIEIIVSAHADRKRADKNREHHENSRFSKHMHHIGRRPYTLRIKRALIQAGISCRVRYGRNLENKRVRAILRFTRLARFNKFVGEARSNERDAMTGPKLYVAGNWKMNGLRADLAEIEAVKAGVGPSGPDVAFFPPATLLHAAASLLEGSPIEAGGQDCRAEAKGAFTGDLSAVQLKDAGAASVIVGHSERRSGHGETSIDIRAKASAALKAGLKVIVCIGETKGEREAGLAPDVCARQLAGSVPDESTPDKVTIAYEPVWAIGTGLTCTTADITAIHELVRSELYHRFPKSASQRWRILYGGSVTAANAASIFESGEVDGALVGGASLTAASFLGIIAAAKAASEHRASAASGK
jgi:triosephosphate isomerase